MKIKFLGQNCFLFTYNDKNILSDPFYNFQKEQTGFDVSAQKIDYVLITHAHGDHTMVPAHHTSSFPDGTYGGQPCGYMFRLPEKNVYFAGDTGVMADMAYFPQLFGEINLSILPIGGHYTMCAKKAAFAASKLLKCKKVIGCHFDTFQPITINHDDTKKLFEEQHLDLFLPDLGQEFEI